MAPADLNEYAAVPHALGYLAKADQISSSTLALHEDFHNALGGTLADEDRSNRCTSLELQQSWLSEIGFSDVDCFWQWHGFTLVAGTKPR